MIHLFLLSIFLFATVFFAVSQFIDQSLINSKNGDHHDFPLGVLEATGRLKDGDKEILIMDVGKGGCGRKGVF